MRQALALAEEAMAEGEVPVGCVIVKDGRVVGRGRNRRETARTALGHAEIEAIADACRTLGGWRLAGCTLYVTLEPCPMCAGAILQARVPRVVIGCMNPKAGCAGSILDMFHDSRFNHQVETETGVLEAECSGLMKDFFAVLRQGFKERKALRKLEKQRALAADGRPEPSETDKTEEQKNG